MLSLPPSKTDHYRGDLMAEVIVVEYGDYECPLSSRTGEWPQILLKIFRHKVCFVYRHFPLRDIHPHAFRAAVAAQIAASYGMFWEMHQLLLASYDDLKCKKLISIAREIGLEEEAFLKQFHKKELIDCVRRDLISGQRSGVTSTPTFFLNNMKLEGPVNLEILQENIVRILRGYRICA